MIKEKFNWFNALERAGWTALEAPAVVSLLDLLVEEVAMPPKALLVSAVAGFVVSFLKTLGIDRLVWLTRRRRDM